MIVKRLVAALAAIGLIAGAWVVRDRVIEGDDSPADQPRDAGVLVCAAELAAVCRAVADELGGDGLRVVEQAVGDTVEEFAAPEAEPALWLTFSPFAEIVDVRRTIAFATPISYTATEIASSRIGAVVRPDVTDTLAAACGRAVDLGCVGEQTDLAPAVSPSSSGIGLITIAAAFAARSDEVLDLDALLPWARGFQRASARVPLSGGTAVGTIQTRPTVAVALGAEAELANSRKNAFDVLYAEPVVRATVELMTPNGLAVPDGLAELLRGALVARGWEPAGAGGAGAVPSAEEMIAIKTFWDDLG